MAAFRKIDYWLDDRQWLQKQYTLQKQAIAKCEEIQTAQTDLAYTLQKDRDFWKKRAKRNKSIVIGGCIALGGAAGLLVWLAVK